MQAKSRSMFIEETIGNFLNSTNSSFNIKLYGSEVKKISRWYKNINVQIMDGTKASVTHPMVLCTITKK